MNVNDATSIGIDCVVIIASGIAFQCLKAFCRRKVFPKIGEKLNLEEEKSRWHFSKQLWGLVWHVTSFIWLLAVLIPTKYWLSTINPYNSPKGTKPLWNYHKSELPPLGIRLLYLVQIGYYFVELVYTTMTERPNDWKTMAAHHIAALLLLWMSYSPKECWKIGMAIVFVHEIGDVTLYLSKTFHYAQMDSIANVLFICNIFTWIWSRLILFPRLIVSLFIDKHVITRIWQGYPSAVLLNILLVMHIYWIGLMIKVLVNSLFCGKEFSDPRDKNKPTMEDKGINVDEVNPNTCDAYDEGGDNKTSDNEIQIEMRDIIMNKKSEQNDENAKDDNQIVNDENVPSPDAMPEGLVRRNSLVASFIDD